MRHRSAKLSALLLCILLACSVLGGCAQAEPQKYSTSFFDVFDTVTTIIGYADSQETFDRVVGEARQQLCAIIRCLMGTTPMTACITSTM